MTKKDGLCKDPSTIPNIPLFHVESFKYLDEHEGYWGESCKHHFFWHAHKIVFGISMFVATKLYLLDHKKLKFDHQYQLQLTPSEKESTRILPFVHTQMCM
jgi:hypothetical protein